MKPFSRSPLPTWKLVVLSLFAFSTGMVSNTLEPAIIGQRAIELAPANARNTAVGLTTFGGLFIAVLAQPLIGSLSDRTTGRWGRRRPFLVIGTVLTLASLFLIALAGALPAIVVGVLVLFIGSNLVQVPGQALVPDSVPRSQYGRAAGFKSSFELLAFVVGRFASGELVARGEIVIAATVPAAVFAISLGVIVALFPDRPQARESLPARRTTTMAHIYAPDLKQYPVFAWWFANRFLFWCGFIALQTFLLFFVIDVIGFEPAGAHQFVGRLSTVIGVAVLIVTIPAGWLTDRIGRRGMIVLAGGLAAVCSLAFLFARTPLQIGLSGLGFGVAVGIFLSANWALVTDIVPLNEAARYLGLANIASAAGSAVARLAGGLVIDPLNALLASQQAGYLALYGFASVLFVASAVVAWRMPLPDAGKRQAVRA